MAIFASGWLKKIAKRKILGKYKIGRQENILLIDFHQRVGSVPALQAPIRPR